MDDLMLFDYVIFAFFGISVLKSAIRGGTSEIISLIFSLIGLVIAGLVYQDSIKHIILAGSLFTFFYLLGTYFGLKNARSGGMEKVFGFIIGIAKAMLMLFLVTVIAMKFEINPPGFAKNKLIEFIIPYSDYIQKLAEQKVEK